MRRKGKGMVGFLFENSDCVISLVRVGCFIVSIIDAVAFAFAFATSFAANRLRKYPVSPLRFFRPYPSKRESRHINRHNHH